VEIVMLRRWWQTIWAQIAAFGALVVAITLIARAWFNRRLKRRIEKLEHETALARERARIAQNIHDDVGASLTRISLLTQASSPTSPDADNLNRIYETTREITRSLDEIVWAVNPQDDTLESFVSYMADFAQKFLAVASIRCRLDLPATLPSISLSSETRHNLFLCCREALNNVVKHAGASEVAVRLVFAASNLTIVIADNGRGLSSERSAPAPDRVSAGHGVGNIQQRMQRLGGSCSIVSPAAGGTMVTLTVRACIANQVSL
jgi:signal transduction histidine kinase